MAAGKRSRNTIRRPNGRARAMWQHARKSREIDLHGMLVSDAIARVSVAIDEAVKRRRSVSASTTAKAQVPCVTRSARCYARIYPSEATGRRLARRAATV
jgi:hypothetical protein